MKLFTFYKKGKKSHYLFNLVNNKRIIRTFNIVPINKASFKYNSIKSSNSILANFTHCIDSEILKECCSYLRNKEINVVTPISALCTIFATWRR